MDSQLLKEISFDGHFPLPFRVLFLAGMGILGWATNLHILDVLKVDVVSVMDLRPDGHIALPSHSVAGLKLVYRPIYRLFTAYATGCLCAFGLFRYATHGNLQLVDAFRYIPAICALLISIILVSPFDVFQKHERDLFLLSIRRCMFPPPDVPVFFSDVIFADVLTSFAKVLGDVWVTISMLLPGGSLLVLPTQAGWSRWILPTIMSLPYLVRLRQCIIDHMLPANKSRRQLFNALKYATAFPVVFLSAAQRIVVSELVAQKGEKVTEESWHSEHPVFRLWLLAALVNSLYSYWWDVTNDWGLDLLKPRSLGKHNDRVISPPRRLVLPTLHSRPSSATTSSFDHPSLSRISSSHEPSGIFGDRAHVPGVYPFGLRPKLLYPLPVYPLLVFLNLVLRLTWSIKLSSHLHSHSDGSEAIFWLEVAELARRWMWVFMRVEWEVVKRAEAAEQRALSKDVSSGEEEDYELSTMDHEASLTDDLEN